MPFLVTKTDLQQREYLHQLDGKKAKEILQETLNELQKQKDKNVLNVFYLKSLNNKFKRQMTKITNLRNTQNKRYRNKWNTIFHQEIKKLR
jgi:hypothetical protein